MRKILIGISLLLLCSMGMVSAETAGLSTTEQAFGRLGIEGAEDLRQYGYDLLSETVPVHSILIDKDYAVNPGDELRIYIWGDSVEIGTIEGLYEVTVNLEGVCSLPQRAGSLPTAGPWRRSRRPSMRS